MKTYHYIIKGRVQGVAFRYYTMENAKKNAVYGTVKNLYNGDVEVYAQGNEENIKRFETFLNSGPPSAVVVQAVKEEIPFNHIYSGFEVVY